MPTVSFDSQISMWLDILLGEFSRDLWYRNKVNKKPLSVVTLSAMQEKLWLEEEFKSFTHSTQLDRFSMSILRMRDSLTLTEFTSKWCTQTEAFKELWTQLDTQISIQTLEELSQVKT